jgi:hypothetical protein
MVREVARIGGAINQVARWLDSATTTGHTRDIDALAVATELVAVERALSAIMAEARRAASKPDDRPC